jgi:hypothetical protein
MSGQTAVVFRNENKERHCLLGLSIWNCLRTQQISRWAVTDSAENKRTTRHEAKVTYLTHARNSNDAAGQKSLSFFLKTERTSPPAPGVVERVAAMQIKLPVSPGNMRCERPHTDGVQAHTARCNCGSLPLQDRARVAVAVEPAVRGAVNEKRNTWGARNYLRLNDMQVTLQHMNRQQPLQ